MSARCRWCGYASFGVDLHECDGMTLSRQHAELRAAVIAALNELGVPHAEYPAPISNAVHILREALHWPF